MIRISSSLFVFDLNKEPCVEDNIDIEVNVEVTGPNLNIGTTLSSHDLFCLAFYYS